MSGEILHYFVEGKCEQAFIKSFVHADKGNGRFRPGKVEVFNVLYERISPTKAMLIKHGTKVVFVFDTDVKKTDVLEDNITCLNKYANIEYKDIYFIPSVKTFEEELVFACDSIKNINELLNTKGLEDFKNKFINHSDIVSKLYNAGFSFEKMWSRNPDKPFSDYENSSSKIKETIKT